jgi:5'-nucleotidase
MRIPVFLSVLLALGACAGPQAVRAPSAAVDVSIIAFNDFHGALRPPREAVPAIAPGGGEVRVPAGGAVYLAEAVRTLRERNPNSAVVSAGDLISASQLISAQFLDEPTILAMNMIGLDFNAVGNHEFDRGEAELRRMQAGGCVQHTRARPCQVDADFPGARFGFLAANVRARDGNTIFPAYGMRSFGSGDNQVQVAFIGLTLEGTPTLVTPAGVAGLTFADEADTINALIPRLRAEGADAIVVLIHQGLTFEREYDLGGCAAMAGDLMPILARLDPEVDLVVSGHTHDSYVCDFSRVDRTRPFLVTSAARRGTMLTHITLSVDPVRGVVGRSAEQVIVQGEPFQGSAGTVELRADHPRFERHPAVEQLVDRYAAASATIGARVVGRLAAPAPKESTASGESVLGNLIADAALAATRGPAAGGAQLAFTNLTGVRTDLVPGQDGAVTFGQLFEVQPFGNNWVVKSMTGRQIRSVLEQQFESGSNTVARPIMLAPSQGVTYAYDLTRPAGQRILDLRLNGGPIAEDRAYRVTMNSFLAAGGDNFTAFREGTDSFDGPIDIEALERYIASAGRLVPPQTNRITRLSPR